MNENNNNEFENENEVKQEPNNRPNFDDFSYSKNAKKALIPMFVGLFTMVLLTVGATWAFYNVNMTGSITNSSVTASTAGRGLITLNGPAVTAKMELSAADMSSATASTAGKTWYATTTGKSDSATSLTLGTATLSGDTSKYTCDYKITAKAPEASNSLITAYKNQATHSNELVLELDNTVYDLSIADHITQITGSNGIVKNGSLTLSGTGGTATKTFTAKFYLKNATVEQNFLAGKSASITITTAVSNCKISTT